MTGVNTLFNALLHNRDFARLDFAALRLTVGGGMAVQQVGGGAMEAGDRQRR